MWHEWFCCDIEGSTQNKTNENSGSDIKLHVCE